MKSLADALAEAGDEPHADNFANLHPDLQAACHDDIIEGTLFIRHPLVVSMYNNTKWETERFNKMYEVKKQHIEEMIAAGNYYSALYLTERPFRLDFLLEHTDEVDDKTYWEMVSSVWVDCENPTLNQDIYYQLFTAARGGREHLMDEDDYKFKDSLPDEFIAYRSTDNFSGLSWTTSFDTALFFSNRFGFGNPIYQTTIKKSEALAFFAGRNEKEVVACIPFDRWEELLD